MTLGPKTVNYKHSLVNSRQTLGYTREINDRLIDLNSLEI